MFSERRTKPGGANRQGRRRFEVLTRVCRAGQYGPAIRQPSQRCRISRNLLSSIRTRHTNEHVILLLLLFIVHKTFGRTFISSGAVAGTMCIIHYVGTKIKYAWPAPVKQHHNVVSFVIRKKKTDYFQSVLLGRRVKRYARIALDAQRSGDTINMLYSYRFSCSF